MARKQYAQELRELLRQTGDEDLLLTNEEIERREAAKTILQHMRAFWMMKKRQRTREAATLKIQTFYRMRFVKNSSFIRALELVKYPKIYFLKEQKPQFIKILRKLITTLQQENMTIDDAYNCIQENQKYDTIRVEEPDLCAYRPLPLL